MKKRVIIIVSVIICLIIILVFAMLHSSQYKQSTINVVGYVSLEENEEYIKDLSDSEYYDPDGREYLENDYIPYKFSVEIINETSNSFFASVIPKIKTDKYILDIHQFDVPTHNGVEKFQTTTIESSIWFKENLTQDEIKAILNEIDLQIKLLYYSPSFTANEASIIIDCEIELVD